MALVWAMQRSMIYFPDASPVPAAGDMLDGAEDIALHTEDGLELGAWFLPHDDAEFAVLAVPGNGGNRAVRAGLAAELHSAGFAVLVMDYRGYGGNPGTPTEAGLRADGLAAVAALSDRGFTPEETVYLGESLGGGVVAALMQEHPPAAAVFRSPFAELADVGAHHYPWLPVRMLLRDEFPVAAVVAESEAPVTVIRAEEDSVVPARSSAEVADSAAHLCEEVVLSGVDHNDPVMFGPDVVEALVRLTESCVDDRP